MNIHILAIAGKMTAPLAIELKNQGHVVTGSDQSLIYPPVSTSLQKNHISVNQTQINHKIDLVIVGSGYKKFAITKQQYNQAKKLTIPTISATKYISQHICKNNSITIAGSYGKTTITGLICQILIKAGLNPSYLIGGTTINHMPSVKIASSDWSVVEGDESINGLDTQAKFLYYKTKYVIITSVNWEHKDSYRTKQDNLNAFKSLIKNIPHNGLLIYNPQNKQLEKLTKNCQAPIIAYNPKLKFDTKLIGLYNHQNISAAYTLCTALNIDNDIIQTTIKNYHGIARRLQLIGHHHDIVFIDDFAQSTDRISSSIQAIKSAYPNRPIKLFFEPHASFLLRKKSLHGLGKALTGCQQIVIAKIPYQSQITKNHRSTAKDFKKELGPKVTYVPLYNQLVDHFCKNLTPNDLLIHMSSGGQIGQKSLQSIIKHFKNKS